ncbi:MAG TPA: dTDP-glucose 4,6-dehydratase [Anaerolineales bacterium]|nr:dTDP-glucose 4,6-dehydratase [Anaerolineales bacterium]
MKQVLVTGGAGFIGSNFVRYLLKAESQVRVINLDALTYAGSLENLKDLPNANRYTFVQGNICDRDFVSKVLREHQIDTIVHFAAETHVDRSILGPEPFVQTNIVGTFTLLEAARQFWLTEAAFPVETIRFHHVSTDEVYGSLSPKDPAFSESTPYAPNSPYAASKASSDHLVRSYGHTFGLPVTISNCSNNYGPYQFPEKLIPLMILNARAGKPLPVYGDGQQIRDWLFVEDHCEAIHTILTKSKTGETYNIGGGNQPANLTIVETICDMLDEFQPASTSYHELIKFVTDRPGHDRRYAMDIRKIQRELGWQPRHSLTDGLRATVEWYLSNSGWMTAIQKQHDYQRWVDQNYQKREKSA